MNGERDEETAGPGRVVVGVSGDSLASLAALRVAAREARRSGRVLVAVLAWEPPEGEALYLRHPDPAWAAHWRGVARGRLAGAFDEAFGGGPPGVVVERRPVWDRPGPALCRVASRPEDLLVVGARGGWWRGRVRRYAEARAVCPVLVVPAPPVPVALRRALRRARPVDFAVRP
ncbi:Universal stress protein family protein [Streptomyces sp. YIM 121038]|uniref:universal stress protein n=1 Tax=Streptomyces sp. YIM 121038 TaxID=2136401 RepID=UPI00111084E2|nr:universal stress protein [Streptomyces sp. YIM 121038]QCX79951.1 Universal stress protein family protein [Streptomyces sp. YIM 121038]